MTHLIFEPIKTKIKEGTYLIYDPACGSGGMLTEAENFAMEINPKAKFHLYGQEVNPETFAICKADMLIKEEDPEKIFYGSTLGNDGFPRLQFDFMLSNPPYGKTWKIDQEAIVDCNLRHIGYPCLGFCKSNRTFAFVVMKFTKAPILILQNAQATPSQQTQIAAVRSIATFALCRPT